MRERNWLLSFNFSSYKTTSFLFCNYSRLNILTFQLFVSHECSFENVKFFQILLDCLLEKFFTSKSFDADRVLIHNVDGKGKNLCIPDGNTREHLISWVENIHYLQLPNWLGLPNSAEKVLLTVRGMVNFSNIIDNYLFVVQLRKSCAVSV